jgi:hypothetical protein
VAGEQVSMMQTVKAAMMAVLNAIAGCCIAVMYLSIPTGVILQVLGLRHGLEYSGLAFLCAYLLSFLIVFFGSNLLK